MASPYELKKSAQVVDVRPLGDRIAESLAEKSTLAFAVGFVLVFTFAIPILLPLSIPLVLGLIIAGRGTSADLPLRYPPSATDPSGKPGNGILYLGNMEYDKKKENRLPLESLADKFKECWFADDDLRKHLLVLGSTGSGKSELLKGIFFNSLCWGSGFFVADGKADNKLPLDTFNLLRFFGREDDLLALNFLLAGSTPEQVRNSRRRRTNKMNPFSTADADTIIQMGANLLPKVDGDAKNWQEKALNCWRGMVPALCWLRDHEGMEISIRTFVDYLSLVKLEELYTKGYKLGQAAPDGQWPEAFEGLKSYLEVGLPGFKLERCLKKHGALPKTTAPGAKPEPMDQDATTYDQHGYRATQLNPALNLLDKTYGHIFADKFSEVDMVDMTLNNRIGVLLIPSLEKSAQEAESLGKLAVACLRVMMGKNLGADIEGHRSQILESKATEAKYPYIIALDELGYYFADGIAVMFAQARSLGFSMIAAAQDIEKLTEGSRAAEAGAMLANQVVKIFMRIDDANKTNEMIQKYLGKANVALRSSYDHRHGFGFKRNFDVRVDEIPRATLEDLQKLKAGRAILNAMGDTFKIASFYVGGFIQQHPTEEFHINRFLQVRSYTPTEIEQMSIPVDMLNAPEVKGQRLKDFLTGYTDTPDFEAHARLQPYAQQYAKAQAMLAAVERASKSLPESVAGARRAVALFEAARKALQPSEASPVVGGLRGSSGGDKDAAASHVMAEKGSSAQSTRTEVAQPSASGATAKPANDAASRSAETVRAAAVGVTGGGKREEGVDPVEALNKATSVTGSKIVHGSGSGTGGEGADAFAPDIFDFLNTGSPLTRKKASELAPSPRVATTDSTQDARAIGLINEVYQATNLKAMLTQGDVAADERPKMPAYLVRDWEQVQSRSFTLSLRDFGLPTEEPSAQRMYVASAGDGWMAKALFQAGQALEARNEKVVGFTQQASASLIRLEKALGNPHPGESAMAVERLVSQQTTPPPLSGDASCDDIEALLKMVSD